MVKKHASLTFSDFIAWCLYAKISCINVFTQQTLITTGAIGRPALVNVYV